MIIGAMLFKDTYLAVLQRKAGTPQKLDPEVLEE
jgi:hypothetical protein